MYTICFSTLICCGWTCGCTLTTLIRLWRWGWIFGKLGVLLSVSHVVKSWLRLQSPKVCIPHSYHIYTMCFSTLICCGWTCGCTLTLIRLWRWGWIFGKLGVLLSVSHVVKLWLRLQTPVGCIPHPYHIYTKCFSTLICYGWTCGCTLTLICLWRWGWIFAKLGVLLSVSSVVKSWLGLQSTVGCIPHPYHIYVNPRFTSVPVLKQGVPILKSKMGIPVLKRGPHFKIY